MSTGSKSRGVLYVVWGRAGNATVDAALKRSLESVAKVHPELPVTVRELPQGATLLDKARMYELSPYDETLCLDADTVVLSRLDYGFQKSIKHGLACAICEAPFARRYEKAVAGDAIEYNTGVLFFSRSPQCGRLFTRWGELNRTIDSSSRFWDGSKVDTMALNDQAGFALAVDELGFNPFVLPTNWNLRPRWAPVVYGPVKVWHDYEPVPDDLRAFWQKQEQGLMHYTMIELVR